MGWSDAELLPPRQRGSEEYEKAGWVLAVLPVANDTLGGFRMEDRRRLSVDGADEWSVCEVE